MRMGSFARPGSIASWPLTVHSRVAQCRSAHRGSVRFGYSLIRVAKAALALSMGLFAGLAGAGNLLDPDANMAFVMHALSMDTVFSASHLAWRVITSPVVHQLIFWLIVARLCLWGAAYRQPRRTSASFQRGEGTNGRGPQTRNHPLVQPLHRDRRTGTASRPHSDSLRANSRPCSAQSPETAIGAPLTSWPASAAPSAGRLRWSARRDAVDQKPTVVIGVEVIAGK